MTAEELKSWRTARGLSQSDLAARLPVPLGTLRDWEQGKREPHALLPRALRDLDRELKAKSKGKS